MNITLRRLAGLDELNRLIRAEEGTLTFPGGVPTLSNRSRDERWQDGSGGLGLSQTGNWLNRRLDLNGDGNFTDAGELDEIGSFNDVNELLARDTDADQTDEHTLAYDRVGNQTDDGQHYTYVYDAFGRMRKVLNRDTEALVAEYRYNGLGFRIGWHSDVTDDGTSGEPDGVVDSNDPWYYFCYDDSWRLAATFRADDADPKEVFLHHTAGLGGYGGSSYIDSVILRDRDGSTAWHEQADATREERRYYCQNWRADVVALLTDAGGMVEWVKYSAYGVPFALPAGDTDSDGDWDATDSTTILGGGAYDVRKDADLDGDVDAADATQAHSITGSYQTLGRGVLSSAGVSNRRGYAGYEYAPEFEGAGRHLNHVRHRVYDAGVGRWTRRDPLGYVDGMSLYEYVGSQPVTARDPWGLFICVGGCQIPMRGPIPTPSGNDIPHDCPSGEGGREDSSTGTQPSQPTVTTPSVPRPTTRQQCFAGCISDVMSPGSACYWPCRVCDGFVDPVTIIGCATGCTIAWLPGVPSWLQLPYRSCVAGCLVGAGVTIAASCPMCAGCVLSQAYICASTCGY